MARAFYFENDYQFRLGASMSTAPQESPKGTLGSMPLGSRALVSEVQGNPAVATRLLEMGLLPGTEIEAIRRSTFGDPLEIELRGYHLSVRLSDGHSIEILPLEGAPLPAAEVSPIEVPAPARPARTGARDTSPRLFLAGNPNSGKTTVFNALTGSSARIGNYPGVTVEERVGELTLGPTLCSLTDLPGTYSLSARSPEESIAVQALFGEYESAPDAVLVIVDSGALERGLYLALQILETGVPLVLGLNMTDEIEAKGQSIDIDTLAKNLNCEVVSLTASQGVGLEDLTEAAGRSIAKSAATTEFPLPLADNTLDAVSKVEAVLKELYPAQTPAHRRAKALWAILSLGEDELTDVPEELRAIVTTVHIEADAAKIPLRQLIIQARYSFIESAVRPCVKSSGEPQGNTWTDTIDQALTHPVLGAIGFTLVMGFLFQMLFAWCDPLIGIVEASVAGLQGWVAATLPAGFFNDLLREGIVAGVGNVLVFAPQIAALFFVIGFLEDCGYLARVAFLLDRLMGGVGLHGKAFVPMLSGFSCAIPAAMATRTIESRLDRLLTMMTLPLMSCSARLPVYVLLIGVLFPSDSTVFGGLSTGAFVLAAMYALSVAATLTAAAILRRTLLKGPRPPLVLELPPYRMPLLRNLLTSTWIRLKKFLIDAGTIILGLTIVLWLLLSFPKRPDLEGQLEAQRARVVSLPEGSPKASAQAELDAMEGTFAQAQLEGSYAGQMGKAIEPVFRPLGFDWRMSIGVIGSFAAREVFVSTMGVVFGIQEADEENVPLRTALQSATWPDGTKLFTTAAGMSLMVFFVLACQCMSTLAVIKKESGSWKWPLIMLAMMTIMAYVASFLVFQIGSALGF